MKKLIMIVFTALAIISLTGCSKKQNNKNSVVCTTTKTLNYNYIDLLKLNVGKPEGTIYDIEDKEEREKQSEKNQKIIVGKSIEETIYGFNKEGTKIEKVSTTKTMEFTHEDVTDDLLNEYKTLLMGEYEGINHLIYDDYKVTIDGKKFIEQFTYNDENSEEEITKQELIKRYNKNSKDSTTICKEV